MSGRGALPVSRASAANNAAPWGVMRSEAGFSSHWTRSVGGQGCSGVTAWWAEAGVWPRLHEILLAELRAAGLLDMDDAAVDGSHVRALKGGLTPDLLRSTGLVPAASTT